MKISRFVAKKVHGTLDIKVDFKEQFTLLVGINGSGKTTVLNMISWLLAMKFGNLASIEFESVQLFLDVDGRAILIDVARAPEKLTVDLIGHSESFPPIIVNLRDPELRGETREHYVNTLNHGLSPEEHERPLWAFIRALPNVINITLERVMAVNDGESSYRSLESRLRPIRSDGTPMDRVNEIIRDKVATMRIRLEKVDTQLTRDLLLSAFMPRAKLGDESNNEDMASIAKNIYSIERDLNANLGIAQGNEGLTLYFQELRAAWEQLSEVSEQELLRDYIYWQGEMTRLRTVSQAFDRAREKRNRITGKWDKYIDTLNSLFEDSGKRIEVGKRIPQLTFSFLNEKVMNPGGRNSRVEKRDLDKLSSGEKQLLILLTYIAFPQQGSRIIVIDEPELSLHLRWQEKFIGALLALADKDLQIIIATHSPAIVGKNRDACVVMPRLVFGA